MIVAVLGRLHGENLDSLAIEHELDLMGLVETFDVLIAVALKAELELVLGVEGEVVVDDGAAARAEGELVEVLLLREVGRKVDGVAAGGAEGAAHGKAADFARGGEVLLHQSGREVADGDVVEAVA